MEVQLAELSVEDKKSQQPKKSVPKKKIVLKTAKGTRDRGPVQMIIRKKVFSIITECFEKHDAVAIETPIFELKEVLTGKYGEDSKLIYDLADQGGELLSLRYDLTVPFARYVAMNKIKKIRRYQIGTVYRRDQPAMNSGRFREFYQCDFDIAGECDLMLGDVECLQIIHDILDKLQLGDFVIKINHRKFLDGLFVSCGVTNEMFATICSSVDKLDKMSWDDARKEMINEKKLPEEVADCIGSYVLRPHSDNLIEELRKDPRLAPNANVQLALNELEMLLKYCEICGIQKNVRFELSLARGLDYYTGLIFEAVLTGYQNNNDASTEPTAPAKKSNKKKKSAGKSGDADDDEEDDSTGAPSVGSVAAGGRYDNLVGMFGNCTVPCVGLSIGVERLFAIMEAKSRAEGQTSLRSTNTEAIVVTAQKGLVEHRLKTTSLLRNAGIKTACIEKCNPKYLAQKQYAELNGIPFAVVIGEEEIARNEVKICDNVTREEWMVPLEECATKLREMLNNKL